MGYGVWADFVHTLFGIGVAVSIVAALVGLLDYLGRRTH